MIPAIGISLGDVTGIGPEVTLKALAAEQRSAKNCYVLIGDGQHVSRVSRTLGTDLQIAPCKKGERDPGFYVYEPLPARLPERLAPGAPEAALASVDWVREGASLCLDKKLDALVTAPLNKEAIIRAGERFVGQTELLSEIAGTDRTAMMLLGQDELGRWLRVTLATTHVPIRLLAEQVTAPKVELAILLAAKACQDLGLKRARVGVCGLNPHAGEGGKMGTEEQDIIGPAVQAARRNGVDVVGPLSADVLFYYAFRGDYDVVVAMYHDQGLAPLKMVAFDKGVNWTLGLPFIRTSPDHGTAYDIAGLGKANPSSMIAALNLAKQLAVR